MALRKLRISATFALALIVITASVSCSTPGEETMPMDDQLQIGEFTVEFKKTEADDVAQILGINRWKYTLQRDSEQEVGLEATLSITTPGEPAEVIDEMRIFTTETEIEGMVALYPLGDSLFNAEEIRIYMQLGSGSTTNVMPNLFKEFSSSYTANPADVIENDNLRLMAFSDNEPMPSPENTVLSLSINTFSE